MSSTTVREETKAIWGFQQTCAQANTTRLAESEHDKFGRARRAQIHRYHETKERMADMAVIYLKTLPPAGRTCVDQELRQCARLTWAMATFLSWPSCVDSAGDNRSYKATGYQFKSATPMPPMPRNVWRDSHGASYEAAARHSRADSDSDFLRRREA